MEQNIGRIRPKVTVLGAGGEHIDISYACEFDYEKGEITFPDNLPGGSEVYVNNVFLCTTAVSLEERAAHMRNMVRKPFRQKLLAVAIGAALYSR